MLFVKRFVDIQQRGWKHWWNIVMCEFGSLRGGVVIVWGSFF